MRNLLLTVVLLLFIFVCGCSDEVSGEDANSVEYVYSSWQTLEFDKCVSVWMITRFIDEDAQFVFYPKETPMQQMQGIVFDVPGAEFSRKHRMCTSQCFRATMDVNDACLDRIVELAAKIELNFWQLDRWPNAQRIFYEVKGVMDANPEPLKCFEKTNVYFDRLYQECEERNE